jgi:hypothetical protein
MLAVKPEPKIIQHFSRIEKQMDTDDCQEQDQ